MKAEIYCLQGHAHKTFGLGLEGLDGSDKAGHGETVMQIVARIFASFLGQGVGQLENSIDLRGQIFGSLLSREVDFPRISAMNHHMGDDFHFEGVDIEKIHVFGQGQVILLDAFQFGG